MEWQPIATYDALKKRPKYAAFYVKERAPAPGRPGIAHPACIALERHYGSREVALWIELPSPPATLLGDDHE